MTTPETPTGTGTPAPLPPMDGGHGAAHTHHEPETAEQKGHNKALLMVERFALPAMFLAVMLFFYFWSKTSDTFQQEGNFQAVLGGQAYIALLSIAVMIPLVCGEFDLSVGQNAGASQIVAAVAMSKYKLGVFEAGAFAVLFGSLIGLANGNSVARIGVNSLIVTLGTSGVLYGVVQWYTKGLAVGSNIPQSLINFGSGYWLGIPREFYLVAVVAVFIWYLLGHTPYGRYLTSVGSNADAARLVGLRVDMIKLSSFVLSGAIAGLAGVMLVANNGSGAPGAGSILDTLQALAAVFLGATAIRPGTFNVEGTMIAIFFLGFTVDGLQLAGAPSYINDVFNGAALFIAVIVSTIIRQHRTGGTG